MTRQRLLLLFGAPCLVAAAVVYPHVPGHDISGCAVYHLLHINCPGCGFTRSIVALVSGHWRQSIDFHPMGLVAALVVACLWVRAFIGTLVSGRDFLPLMSGRGTAIVSTAFVAGMFVQWFFYLAITIYQKL